MRKLLLRISIIIFLAFISYQFRSYVLAEQSGSTPESGATSRIKTIYDSLVSLSHGSDSSGSWGDWGEYWNRIRSAAEWVPNGDATASDVASGLTFYNNSRELITGTATPAFDYSLQSLTEYDDYRGVDTGDPEDGTQEESTWVNTSTNVWLDEKTGLYWTNNIGTFTNQFPNLDHSGCSFFSTNPRGSYDGDNSDCGNSINACGNLELDSNNDSINENDWYLPTQKELMQGYLDGIFNQSDLVLNWNNVSSTEMSESGSNVWAVSLLTGDVFPVSKSAASSVRCVRRD